MQQDCGWVADGFVTSTQGAAAVATVIATCFGLCILQFMAGNGVSGAENTVELSSSAGTSTEELRSQIRGSGLRGTASRIAVLRLLRTASKPVSHAEVVESLKNEPWDRATLYRNLVDMEQAGLARKVELGDRVWRFDGAVSERAHDATLHPHFVCTTCGDVQCLPEVSINSPVQKGPRALSRLEVEVQVRGVCDDCDEVIEPATATP